MSGDSLAVGDPPVFDLGDRSVWLHRVAISAIHSVDSNSEAAHEHAITLLREDIGSAMEAAGRILDQAEDDPLLKWSIINNLATLGDEACIDILHGHAAADYGERNPEACGEARDSEVLVGIMAAEGLAQLADTGSGAALEALIDVIRIQREPAIREAAGQPLVASRAGKEYTIPGDIQEEMDRIRQLRAVVADDVRLDEADIDTLPPHRVCARKPSADGGSIPPMSFPTSEGDNHG